MWYEAIAQFELYRILKNRIVETFEYKRIHFVDIIPEYIIKKESKNERADLVLYLKSGTNKKPFAVIEVKMGKVNKNPASKDSAVAQAKRYAKALNSPYYIVTDGEKITCFRSRDDELIAFKSQITNRTRPGTRVKKRVPNISLEKWTGILEELVRDYQDGK